MNRILERLVYWHQVLAYWQGHDRAFDELIWFNIDRAHTSIAYWNAKARVLILNEVTS